LFRRVGRAQMAVLRERQPLCVGTAPLTMRERRRREELGSSASGESQLANERNAALAGIGRRQKSHRSPRALERDDLHRRRVLPSIELDLLTSLDEIALHGDWRK